MGVKELGSDQGFKQAKALAVAVVLRDVPCRVSPDE
jgi:hypothetical protein